MTGLAGGRRVRDYNRVPGGKKASATFTPTADPYGAGDVMAGAKVFSGVCDSDGGEIVIRSVSLRIDHNALVAAEAGYTLHLYSVTPPSALADNAAFDLPSGDRASYLGKIALGTPIDLGSTLWVETQNINKFINVPAASVGSIYGYLVTDAGITPTAAARVVTLHTEMT